MAPFLAPFENLERRVGISRAFVRVISLLLLLLAGWLDYITGPELASAPFYILILIPIAFFEPPWVCLAYSMLAAGIYLGADLLSVPGTATMIYPYWRALARLVSFSLISSTISLLFDERRRLRRSEQALQEKAQELEERNRALEEAMRQVKRLQEELVAKERRAAIIETIHSATLEMERPLVSISVYAEELLRLTQRGPGGEDVELLLDEIRPILEKVQERSEDMEAILKQIRDFGRREAS